ncbi:polar amino acid transport system substrate-binding protein [Azospirillum lipoferum]|uniref:Transporter substrate-binding domain-containing protein n=1 Tax=Azospirillum lipoferum TaxID=193 RepID=A0A5A9GKB1_AZOLI|nr:MULTISPECIES: transporter substrate-binding domain-containing protein [Azospirillum]KAA0594763.1 transporter substrate-binding domain-containing protein [Azospirillum lipoferum]MCP1612919.1 polar amino acid transport system substrate-binding protein [Azospirillum lipoferum]MDW5532891.1 transporter substrate-binding domain-containing protein [Azospirillum sp. NL1]
MRTGILIATAAVASAAATPALSETLKIYSVDAPPMTMDQADQRGFVADITLEALKRAGYQGEMIFDPWKRGQQEVADGENLLIIPFARSPAREPNYTWIAKIFTTERTFATVGKSIDSFEQAKAELTSIIVGQGTAQEELLKAKGFTQTQLRTLRVGQKETEVLSPNGDEAWFNGTPETLWKWKRSSRPEKIVIGKAVSSDDVYLACSLKCSPQIVETLKTAVDSVIADGTAQRISDRYLK